MNPFSKKLITLLLGVCSCVFFHLHGQNVRFQHIGLKDGLSQSSGHCLLQDQQGFIWIGTEDGLNRYDGYTFQVYRHDKNDPHSISGNNITGLIQDKKGNIWITTRGGGLNKFDPILGRFTSFLKKSNIHIESGSPRMAGLAIDDNDIIWVGTERGLLQFDIANEKPIDFTTINGADEVIDVYINDIIKTHNGNIILGITGGIVKFNMAKQQFTKEEIKINNKPLSVSCLLEDSNGDLWIGGNTGLVFYEYDSGRQKIYTYDVNDDETLSDNQIVDIIETKDGNIWCTTASGINCLDRMKDVFIRYNEKTVGKEGLYGEYHHQIIQDRTGILWAATYNGGVNKIIFNTKGIDHVIPSEGISSSSSARNIWLMVKDKNDNLWCGTNDGLYAYNLKTNQSKVFKENKETTFNLILAVHIDAQGQLWAGYDGNLVVYDPKSLDGIWQNEKLSSFYLSRLQDENPFPNVTPSCFFEDRENGRMWVGTYGQGVYQVGLKGLPEKVTYKTFKNVKDKQLLPSNLINTIVVDSKGTLWFATDGGLCYWDEKKRTFIPFPFPLHDNRRGHLTVDVLYIDEDDIFWFGNQTGLYAYNLETDELLQYTTSDGLPNNKVYSIEADHKGNLWMGTNRGIAKFDKTIKQFSNYDEGDGMQSNEFNWNSSYLDESGNLYFGGINGLSVFHSDKMIGDRNQPEIVLTNFKVFNTDIEVNKTNRELGISLDDDILLTKDIAVTDTIRLSDKHRVFSFEFSALHYLNESRNMYRYVLEGFDDEWVETTANDRKATYTNLNPGTYRFKVMGANSDGLWNPNPKEVVVVIVPPFWQTIWFYVLVLLFSAAMVFVLLRSRIKQVRLKERNDYLNQQANEKSTMLREIHHRVKNNLQVVNSLLKLQARDINDDVVRDKLKEAQNRVITMANLHEQLYRSDDVANIEVSKHISLLINDLVATYALDKNIKLDIEIEEIPLTMEQLVPLGLVINELITNALKYAFVNASEGEIKVHLKRYGSDAFLLLIGDNGLGLDSNNIKEGLGSKLVNLFVKQLGGTIRRLNQKGTYFELKF